VKNNPTALPDERSEPEQVEQRPGMAMVGIDKTETEFAG